MGLLDNAKEFLKSDQAEELSDQAIQAAQDKVNSATGGQYAEQVQQGAQVVDDHIGNEGAH